MTQNYANHPHRPWLTVAVFGLALAAAICLVLGMFGRALGFLVAAVICLGLISRNYTTRLQDRIITIEMRYRADRLLPPDQRATLWTLARPQVMALRFASDAELPALVDRAAKEQLSADSIKRAIKNWQPDWDRT